MRKVLFTLLLVLPMMVMAQVKIGIVNSADVFNAMPEKVAAEKELATASGKIKAENNRLQEEFNAKFADYQEIAADASTPAAIKERRIQELHQLDGDIQTFLTRENQVMRQYRQDLMEPIEQRIQTAIEQVSEEMGLAIVFDTAKTAVAYTGPYTEDITPRVKARLGLK